MPILFTSHGAPDIIASDNATTRFWRDLGEQLNSAKRIVVMSAHWCTPTLMIGAHVRPATVHDFGGFADALYQLQYPANGDEVFAQTLADKLATHSPVINPQQGLDHGMWIPLLAMRPQADIAVIPVSLPMSYSLDQLWQLGADLKDAMAPDDWLICSGATTHNLRAIFSQESQSENRMQSFREWLLPRVLRHDREQLTTYRATAPFAQWNHPSDEHFRPLFVALGAAGSTQAEHVLSDVTYRLLAMDHFIWTKSTV